TLAGRRPSQPGTGRSRPAPRALKKENCQFSIEKKRAICRACCASRRCDSMNAMPRFHPERLNNAREGYKNIEDFIRRFVQAGGIIRAGSDPNNGLPGLGVHQEITMFVEAGLTPMQAIQAATINVARAFRKDKDFGTVEAGKVADIIAVEGDPLKDVW